MERIPKSQLKRINRMLMEMASGNFFYKLERSGNHDNLEAMMLILNMLAEEIRETLVQRAHPHAQGKVKYAIQMSFLLDHLGQIEMVNKHTCLALSHHLKDFIGSPFIDFLDKASQGKWQLLLQKMEPRDFYDTSLELGFVSKPGLLVPSLAHITTIKGDAHASGRTLVTVVHYSRDLEEQLNDQQKAVMESDKEGSTPGNRPARTVPRLSFDDIRKIREGRNLIMNNLERDLPSLKEFAHQLGTNEFKLKYGFKQLYGTSVFRFLLQERLRKSKMLIQHTDHPIKTIAYKTGFKSIPHFSRVFKKTYGYTPSALRKSTRGKET